MVIDSFRGDYSYLSNFWDCTLKFKGVLYNNAESAFQSQKCPSRYKDFIGLSGAKAKKLGKEVELRADWEQVKIKLMTEIVLEKFLQNYELAVKLLATEDAILVEGNTWGDRYWGVCCGIGKNNLGIILMSVRQVLRTSEVFETK